MVVNNFDDELIQLCLCGHLGCPSDKIDECVLDGTVSKDCACENCSCQEVDTEA